MSEVNRLIENAIEIETEEAKTKFYLGMLLLERIGAPPAPPVEEMFAEKPNKPQRSKEEIERDFEQIIAKAREKDGERI